MGYLCHVVYTYTEYSRYLADKLVEGRLLGVPVVTQILSTAVADSRTCFAGNTDGKCCLTLLAKCSRFDSQSSNSTWFNLLWIR